MSNTNNQTGSFMSDSSYSNLPAKVKQEISPASQDAEMMVLGSMLSSVNSVNTSCALLKEDDFFYSQHKILFRSLFSLYKKNSPVDVFTVQEELKSMGLLESAGGVGFLVTTCQFAGTSVFIEEYIKMLLDYSLRRKLIAFSAELIAKAKDPLAVASDIMEWAQKSLFDMWSSDTAKNLKLIRDVIEGKHSDDGKTFMQIIEERQAYYLETGKSMLPLGVPTGFIDVDKTIEGMGQSNLIILAARPAMGKTAFGLNIVENIAVKQQKSVGIFSLEMSADQLVGRIISSVSEVNANEIKKGTINGKQYQDIYEAVETIKQSTILIDDSSDITIGELRIRARRMKETHNIAALVIDYLGLISLPGKGKENKQQEVAEISRQLKLLAKELNIPVLCLAQLNRKAAERESHRPVMSDLRDSGAIEQDADVVMFLHRDSYYNEKILPGAAECIVAKNRHGAIGSVQLTFRAEIARFGNAATKEQCEQARHLTIEEHRKEVLGR